MPLTVVGSDSLILAAPGISVLPRLSALAGTEGYERQQRGPVLVVRGTRSDLDAFVLTCAAALSAAEAASTRALFLEVDLDAATAEQVLGPALVADSLAALAARKTHGGLIDALVHGEGVQTVYQPVIEIRTGNTIGFEALLRLQYDGRAVPPMEIFHAAADAGRLPAADAAARLAAIRGAAGWIGRRRLFLNVQPQSIVRPEDIEETIAALGTVALDPHQVTFEAKVNMDDDVRHLARVLDHLRQRGFGIALADVTDDRGALTLIAGLRPDVVKIARSMVAELPSIQARSAVATVVGSSHEVGARVVATGIETAAQLDAVLFVGVDDAQGWEVGQPMRPPGVLATSR